MVSPAALQSAPVIIIYVAPNGDDSWSGKLASPSPGGGDGPLATLQAALGAARKARGAAASDAGVEIRLRAGTYPLSEALNLTPEDSGSSSQSPLVVAADDREKPVISGGRRLTGWTRVPGEADKWRVQIPEVAAGKLYFHELFINGARKQRARTPNAGFYRVDGQSPSGHPASIHFRDEEIKPSWAESPDTEVVALLAWSDFRLSLRSVDPGRRVAVLSGDAAGSNRENDARYYIENAPDGLDQAGEWRLDRKSGWLTYWADPGENPNDQIAVAPILTKLVRISGDLAAQRPVQHVRFERLAFCFTDWATETNGYIDTQAAVSVPASFEAEGAVDCMVSECEFSHFGGYAVGFGRACQKISILRNDIHDIGAGGIRLGEPAERTDDFDQNTRNEITDNHLHGLGRVYAPGVGLIIFQSSRNHVAHNEINDLYYTAISVGWHWGYEKTPCHDNVIEFNHLHDIGQGMLSDMGAVYTLGPQPGTVIRNNLIHDVDSFTYGGWGLYTDEGSSDIVLENNVVYRTKSAGFHQHYGANNIIRNNIFAFGREHQLMRTRSEDHLSFSFERNIVYFDSGDLFGSNWTGDESKFKMASNLYFDSRPGAQAQNMNFTGGSFEAWQRLGHDPNSMIADPMFIDPSAADFRLKPDSPAFKLGFRAIDLSGVGVRPRSE